MRWALVPVCLAAAVLAYVSLEKVTGGDARLFRAPKPFVAPPPPAPPPMEVPAPPELKPVAPQQPVPVWKLPPW